MGDERVVDVRLRDARPSVREQKLHQFARLAIHMVRLLPWSHLLPFVDPLTDERMHRLRVSSQRLVHWHIEEAYCVAWKNLSCFWHRHIFVLPAHTAHA